MSGLVTFPAAKDPVHVLRVEATWFCEELPGNAPGCVPVESCEGHPAKSPAATYGEVEYMIEHPAECPVPPCCCKDGTSIDYRDPNCDNGRHDECLNVERCATARELSEWGLDTFELPQVTGAYRIQAWWTGPDYWGEYDNGIEHEPLHMAVAG